MTRREVAMRTRHIAGPQGALRLGWQAGRWDRLPDGVRKEVVALLSLLLRDHARRERDAEREERK